MSMLYLLIVLTQNGAGDINASFVNTQTLAQCQQKSIMLEAVFKSSNIPVIESRCIKSDWQFSEFNHASSSARINYFYLIKVGAETVHLKQLPNWGVCMAEAKQEIPSGKLYCSSSVQKLMD